MSKRRNKWAIEFVQSNSKQNNVMPTTSTSTVARPHRLSNLQTKEHLLRIIDAETSDKNHESFESDSSTRGRGERALVASTENLPSPVGFENLSTVAERPREADPGLINKRSWDIALGPIKQVPMNMFIMWMAGSSISIFPIMMVGMMFFRPIQAMLSIQNTFKSIEGDQAAFQKLVYCIGNLACLAMAVYKCQTMGLLPTHASDWLAFVQPQERMEWSGGGMFF